MAEGVDFDHVPEGCIAHILSFTSRKDVCRLSLVSSTFRSAAESDTIWGRLLSSRYPTIISQPSSSSLPSSSKNIKPMKKLLYLCQKPLLMDRGRKSFQLDKKYGKICIMLSARILSILSGDQPKYWRWTSRPEARFTEVAELVRANLFEIRGRINTGMLSPKTLYGAYLVFKPSRVGTYGFDKQPVKVSIGIAGGNPLRQTVFLVAEKGWRLKDQKRARFHGTAETPATEDYLDLQYPKKRGDGWLEVEMGEFFNEGGEDKRVEMVVYAVKSGDRMRGLLVQGIEIKPKTTPCMFPCASNSIESTSVRN
ncbi:F-box protein PP2-B10 [Spatholobus suberectus]|nr:F-box protein PP2-B10 [Spatholobus suberectus]